MKKAHLVFLTLIALEIFFFIMAYIFLTGDCGSPCDNKGPLNPFGWRDKPVVCAGACTPYDFHPLYFIMSDLLFLTIISYTAYAVYLFMYKRRKRR